MSIFEFLSVSVAIVLAAAMGRLISATTYILNVERRDWLHLGYCIASLLAILLTWWLQWQMSNIESWHFTDFLLLMGSPISIYLAVHVLVTENPAAVVDWRTHFERIHRWYFTALLAQAIMSMIRQLIVQSGGFMTNSLLPAVIISIFVVGIVSRSRKLHTAVLISWAVVMIFVVFQQPVILS